MKKFALTTNTRIKFGRKLTQIKAVSSFEDVKEGNLGGWVENENSLGDDVWIYRDAEVFKDAVIRGGVIRGGEIWGGEIRGGVIWGGEIWGGEIRVSPIFISGLRWAITITPDYMRIGCEQHSHAEWESFKRTDIAPMEERAWDWWKAKKSILLELCKEQVADYNEAKSKDNA